MVFDYYLILTNQQRCAPKNILYASLLKEYGDALCNLSQFLQREIDVILHGLPAYAQ